MKTSKNELKRANELKNTNIETIIFFILDIIFLFGLIFTMSEIFISNILTRIIISSVLIIVGLIYLIKNWKKYNVEKLCISVFCLGFVITLYYFVLIFDLSDGFKIQQIEKTDILYSIPIIMMFIFQCLSSIIAVFDNNKRDKKINDLESKLQNIESSK